MIIPFDINFREEIESGKYKTVAHNGQPVRIICWDARNYWDTPIIGLYYNGEVDVLIKYNIHGASGNNETSLWIETGESEDEKTRTQLLDFLEKKYTTNKQEQKPAEWNDYKDKVNVPYCSSEPEWSEEDELMRNACIAFIKDEKFKGYERSYECIDWLKSLRPQNLPTWERDIPETHDPYTWFVRNGYRISIDDLWKKLPKKEEEE